MCLAHYGCSGNGIQLFAVKIYILHYNTLYTFCGDVSKTGRDGGDGNYICRDRWDGFYFFVSMHDVTRSQLWADCLVTRSPYCGVYTNLVY